MWAHHTPSCRMGCSTGPRWKGTKTQQTPPGNNVVSFPWCLTYKWEQCLTEWVPRKHLLESKRKEKGSGKGKRDGERKGEKPVPRPQPGLRRLRPAFCPRPPAPLPGGDSKRSRVPERGSEPRGTDFLHLDHLLVCDTGHITNVPKCLLSAAWE